MNVDCLFWLRIWIFGFDVDFVFLVDMRIFGIWYFDMMLGEVWVGIVSEDVCGECDVEWLVVVMVGGFGWFFDLCRFCIVFVLEDLIVVVRLNGDLFFVLGCEDCFGVLVCMVL